MAIHVSEDSYEPAVRHGHEKADTVMDILRGGIFSGDKRLFVPLYNSGCCVMLWLPRNEKGVITGQGAERRVQEFSCSSEQNKTCKKASFLPKCPEDANVLKARV